MKNRLFQAGVVVGVLLLIAGGTGYFSLGSIVKPGQENVGPRVIKIPGR